MSSDEGFKLGSRRHLVFCPTLRRRASSSGGRQIGVVAEVARLNSGFEKLNSLVEEIWNQFKIRRSYFSDLKSIPFEKKMEHFILTTFSDA